MSVCESLLVRLMGQYCSAGCRQSLSSSSVTLPAVGPAGRRAPGQSGGRHCMAGQLCYISLGQHVILNGNDGRGLEAQVSWIGLRNCDLVELS